MTAKLLLKYVNISHLAISLSLVFLLWRKQKFQDFAFFFGFLYCRIALVSVVLATLFFRKQFHLPYQFAWEAFWTSYWLSFVIQAIFEALTIYAIYRSAMKPLPGLQKIGQIIFRWIAGISFGLSVFFAIGPKTGAPEYWSIFASQTHQGVSVLSLCLLFFVCLAIRPLGLTFRSQLFGVSLGLGISAAASLIEAAWFPTASARSIYSPVYLIGGFADLVALIVWMVYFILPEPERKLVLLPTTSPFFMWNSISEALGDEPGFVAVAGFTPDMLSSAEIEELSRPPRPSAVLGEGSDEEDDDEPSSGTSFIL